MQPKILIFDIETAPILFYGWKLGEEIWDPKFIRRDWFILCWSAKWLGKKKIMHSSLPEFRGYKPLPSRTQKNIDKGVVMGLRDLLDECDIAIAHNLNGFDHKKAQTRFLINEIPPPSLYQKIDTLSVARSQFKFTSNKLGYIAKKLCTQQKMDAGGFETWLGCERGDEQAWKRMIKYCDMDVRSDGDIYKKFIPYIPKHPYAQVIENNASCPRPECKGKGIVKDGIRRRNDGIFQKLRCIGCGAAILSEVKNG